MFFLGGRFFVWTVNSDCLSDKFDGRSEISTIRHRGWLCGSNRRRLLGLLSSLSGLGCACSWRGFILFLASVLVTFALVLALVLSRQDMHKQAVSRLALILARIWAFESISSSSFIVESGVLAASEWYRVLPLACCVGLCKSGNSLQSARVVTHHVLPKCIYWPARQG